MNITDIKVRKINAEGRMKAVVSVTFDDAFVVHDIKVIEGQENAEIKISGTKEHREEYNYTTHYVNNVTIKDVIIKDKIVDESYSNLTVNLTNNLKFEKSNNVITGAQINYKDISNYGTNYILDII